MKYQYGWAYPDVDEFMASQLKEDGSYQGSHLAMALSFVKDFSLAIDAGAHVGTWARPMSLLFAQVIAVEPSPDTFACLQENLRQFGVQNVELKNVALGAHAGLVSMELNQRETERLNTGARYTVQGGEIPRETIDSWQVPSLGFLKLDVEGSEPYVLEGAIKTLKRCRPIVLFEDKGLWKRFELPRNAPHVILTKLGYRHLARASCDEIWGHA